MTTFIIDVVKLEFHISPDPLDVDFLSSVSTLQRHPCAQGTKMSAGIGVVDILGFVFIPTKTKMRISTKPIPALSFVPRTHGCLQRVETLLRKSTSSESGETWNANLTTSIINVVVTISRLSKGKP